MRHIFAFVTFEMYDCLLGVFVSGSVCAFVWLLSIQCYAWTVLPVCVCVCAVLVFTGPRACPRIDCACMCVHNCPRSCQEVWHKHGPPLKVKSSAFVWSSKVGPQFDHENNGPLLVDITRMCVCLCVRHTFCQLAYRSDPSTDFYSVDSLTNTDLCKMCLLWSRWWIITFRSPKLPKTLILRAWIGISRQICEKFK